MRNVKETVGSPPKKRGRKRQGNRENWKKSILKRLRNSGLCYESVKLEKKENGHEKKVVKRSAKKILPSCNDKCRFNCAQKFSEESREQIFEEYWNMANLQRQRDFIAASMQTIRPKYAVLGKRRRENHAFYFLLNKVKVRVCKKKCSCQLLQ